MRKKEESRFRNQGGFQKRKKEDVLIIRNLLFRDFFFRKEKSVTFLWQSLKGSYYHAYT